MSCNKPLASLSLDLDDQWTYLKTHGDPAWQTLPSYLEVVVPRVLRILDERRLRITFFIVGQDAAFTDRREVLHSIAASGHEIGNHSFHHEPWLHLYSEAEIEGELASAEQAIEDATGERPVGFRGPGFSLSAGVLRVLMRRGYLYDASTFPTFLGPLARTYYFLTARLSAEEKRRRAGLFGTLGDGLRAVRPYRWIMDERRLLEIPVTTMPLMKVPIHASYLLYLSTFSEELAVHYFRVALLLCRATGTPPSLLLHPLDFLGRDDTEDLAFFPAMNVTSGRKLALVSRVLDLLASAFRVVPLREQALALRETPGLPAVKPRFRLATR